MEIVSVGLCNEELGEEETTVENVTITMRVEGEWIMGLCTIIVKDVVLGDRYDVNGGMM